MVEALKNGQGRVEQIPYGQAFRLEANESVHESFVGETTPPPLYIDPPSGSCNPLGVIYGGCHLWYLTQNTKAKNISGLPAEGSYMGGEVTHSTGSG